MRKQFNLQDWLKDTSQKVETRDGRPARIVCWDRKGSLPLVVLVPTKNGDEYSYDYTSDGSYHFGKRKSEFDLFIVTPEEELTEFEQAVEAIYESCNVKQLALKKKAAELLAIARKELEPKIKAEALKDLPRWKEYATAGMKNGELSLTLYSGVYEVSDLFIDRGLYIPISELQKLPGFND